MDGIDPKILQQEIRIPPMILRMESMVFNFTMSPDGSETQIHFTWMHPVLPIEIVIPFQQLYYLKNFADKVMELHDKATEAQETSA